MRGRDGGLDTDLELLLGLLQLEEERREAALLVRDLQMGVRAWADLTREERDRVGGAPYIELLLERSMSFRYSDPEAMLRCAQLATELADSLDPERYGAKLLADLRAKAWGFLANAYRVTDQLSAAEEGFSKAVNYLRQGSGVPHLLTQIVEMMAALRRDRRQFSEAALLLEALAGYYRANGDHEALSRSLLSRGYLASEANEPEDAIRWLIVALRSLPIGSALKLSVIHNLCISLVDAGYPLESEAILRKHEGLYRRSGRLNVLRHFWLKGRIGVALGNSRRAEGDLQIARIGFKRAEQNYDSALVSLDLAHLYARAGQRTSTIRLVDEMVRTFRELGIARETIASLLLLRKRCDRQWNPETICALIETIALTVEELGRRQERSPSV